MLRSDEFIALGPNGFHVWVHEDFPQNPFTADDLRRYVTRHLNILSLEQCEYLDRVVAILRRLDAHKS